VIPGHRGTRRYLIFFLAINGINHELTPRRLELQFPTIRPMWIDGIIVICIAYYLKLLMKVTMIGDLVGLRGRSFIHIILAA